MRDPDRRREHTEHCEYRDKMGRHDDTRRGQIEMSLRMSVEYPLKDFTKNGADEAEPGTDKQGLT